MIFVMLLLTFPAPADLPLQAEREFEIGFALMGIGTLRLRSGQALMILIGLMDADVSLRSGFCHAEKREGNERMSEFGRMLRMGCTQRRKDAKGEWNPSTALRNGTQITQIGLMDADVSLRSGFCHAEIREGNERMSE